MKISNRIKIDEIKYQFQNSIKIKSREIFIYQDKNNISNRLRIIKSNYILSRLSILLLPLFLGGLIERLFG